MISYDCKVKPGTKCGSDDYLVAFKLVYRYQMISPMATLDQDQTDFENRDINR